MAHLLSGKCAGNKEEARHVMRKLDKHSARATARVERAAPDSKDTAAFLRRARVERDARNLRMATGQRIGRAEPDARRAIDHRTGSATTTQERRGRAVVAEKVTSSKTGFPSFVRATSQGRLSVMLGDETT